MRAELTLHEWVKLMPLLVNSTPERVRERMDRPELTDEWIEAARLQRGKLMEEVGFALEAMRNDPRIERSLRENPLLDAQTALHPIKQRVLERFMLNNDASMCAERFRRHDDLIETMARQIDETRQQLVALKQELEDTRRTMYSLHG